MSRRYSQRHRSAWPRSRSCAWRRPPSPAQAPKPAPRRREEIRRSADAVGRSRPARHLAEHAHARRPVQRPATLAGRTELSDEEMRSAKNSCGARPSRTTRNSSRRAPAAAGAAAAPALPTTGANDGRPQRQTALIVEPADGRMPPMTPDGQRRNAGVKTSFNDVVYASPEDFSYLRSLHLARRDRAASCR